MQIQLPCGKASPVDKASERSCWSEASGCELPSHVDAAIAGMLEAMGDHELYCAAYAGKDQPHVDGLLMTLADGLRSKEHDIAAATEARENIDGQELAPRILHRLMSSTNRRMHKGFPEMLTYLLRRPMEYCSHTFRHVTVDGFFRIAMRVVPDCWEAGRSAYTLLAPGGDFLAILVRSEIQIADYPFRPNNYTNFSCILFVWMRCHQSAWTFQLGLGNVG